MEFIRRANVPTSQTPLRLGILPGSFNPPTIAHLGLLEAARPHVDELLCVIPRAFPHKDFHGARLEQRLEMLLAAGLPAECSIAVSERGLFSEIAEECRVTYAVPLRPVFICGRDAAQRIVEWNYGREGAIEEMLLRFELLVAPRGGHYEPPAPLRLSIHRLPVTEDRMHVSSTEVRERLRRGEPWEHLVPEALVPTIRSLYPNSGTGYETPK